MNQTKKFGTTDSFIWIIIGLAIILFIGGIFYLAVSGKKTQGEEVSSLVNNNEESYFKGGADAPVTIVEFSDFECPACAQYHQILQQINDAYGDDVKIIFRHFPLTSIHKNSLIGAEAAEAAGARGKFWEMHDILYDKQSEWENLSGNELIDKFKEFAREIGISDVDTFAQEITDSVYEQKINTDIDAATQLDLNATPTIFLNGVQVSNPTFSNLEKEIQIILDGQNQ